MGDGRFGLQHADADVQHGHIGYVGGWGGVGVGGVGGNYFLPSASR
jgi:hypothetical protein